jgi:hypothetical protein
MWNESQVLVGYVRYPVNNMNTEEMKVFVSFLFAYNNTHCTG